MVSNKKIVSFLFTYFIPFLMIDYYLIMRGININVLLLLIYAIFGLMALKIAIRGGTFIRSLNCFVVYSLFTVFFYLFNGVPLTCFFETLRSFLFPIIFAYLGYKYSSDNQFNKWYLIGCAFCFLIGFYLYVTVPPYYAQFLAEMRSNAWNINDSVDETNIMEMARFSSFFVTSYGISSFSIPALILSLSYSMKDNAGIKKQWCYFIAVVSFIAAILCQQRIAIVFSFIIIIFFIIYSNRLTKTKSNIGLIFTIVIVGALAVFLLGKISKFDWFERIYDLVALRFDDMSFSGAMSERTHQYSSFDRATELSYFFGLGLGSCGHAAAAVGLRSINDGEFVKLFYEFGLVGCSLLAVVIIPTLLRCVKNFKLYYAETLIIVFFLAAGIGADSLTFFIFSIMFWYSLGRVWNVDYNTKLKEDY